MWLSCGWRRTQSLLEELLRAWGAAQPRLAFVWQAQYSWRRWAAAGFAFGGAAARLGAAGPRRAFVAGAVNGIFWRSCCARGRHWVWQAQYAEPFGGAAARVGARWAAAVFRVARAVHRAGAAGPRLAFMWLHAWVWRRGRRCRLCGRRDTA